MDQMKPEDLSALAERVAYNVLKGILPKLNNPRARARSIWTMLAFPEGCIPQLDENGNITSLAIVDAEDWDRLAELLRDASIKGDPQTASDANAILFAWVQGYLLSRGQLPDHNVAGSIGKHVGQLAMSGFRLPNIKKEAPHHLHGSAYWAADRAICLSLKVIEEWLPVEVSLSKKHTWNRGSKGGLEAPSRAAAIARALTSLAREGRVEVIDNSPAVIAKS